MLSPIVVIFLSAILIIVANYDFKDISVEQRKKQAKEVQKKARTGSLLTRVTQYTDAKVKFNERAEIALLMDQAGLKYTYAHYYLFKLGAAIGFALIGLIFNNIYLAISLFFVGRMLPKQVIVMKKNKRVGTLEKQIGPFLQMIIKRYVNTKDFEKSLKLTAEEFKGMQPLYDELIFTVGEIDAKIPINTALENLAVRCNNSYLRRFADYYKIAAEIGTQYARENLLNQAYLQYEEDRELKALLKKELSEPKRDAMIMIMSIPLFTLSGFILTENYADFLFNSTIGQIMLAAVFLIVMGLLWFTNNKIAGPLK